MGLKDELLTIPLEQRFSYRPDENLFFVNFEGLSVTTHELVEDIRSNVERALRPVGQKVYCIVNYDNFSMLPEMVDHYSEMVEDVVSRFYSGVTRYTTSAFLRMKLGDALAKRSLAPHIYETPQEARKHLDGKG